MDSDGKLQTDDWEPCSVEVLLINKLVKWCQVIKVRAWTRIPHNDQTRANVVSTLSVRLNSARFQGSIYSAHRFCLVSSPPTRSRLVVLSGSGYCLMIRRFRLCTCIPLRFFFCPFLFSTMPLWKRLVGVSKSFMALDGRLLTLRLNTAQDRCKRVSRQELSTW